MILAGVDLAWQSEENPSAIAYGGIVGDVLLESTIEPPVYEIATVFDMLNGIDGLIGVAIDAPLIINKQSGQYICETAIGRYYGSRDASCHTSNTKLYPSAKSVHLSEQLIDAGFSHLEGKRWQIECYPHLAIIEIFGLRERLKYKKGTVADKRTGQRMLAALVRNLYSSSVLKLSVNSPVKSILDEHYVESLRGQALKSNEDALDAVLCLYIAGLYAVEHSGQVYGVRILAIFGFPMVYVYRYSIDII